MEKIKNFLLSKVKKELGNKSPILNKTDLTKVVEYNLNVIDDILLDIEGITFAEYTPSSKRYKALRKFISALAHQGFTQATEESLAKMCKVSRPLIREVIGFLEELNLIHKLKNRRRNLYAPTVYVLVLHPYYLHNLKYLKENYAGNLEVSEVYTTYFTKDLTSNFTKVESQTPCESKDEGFEKSPNRINKVNSKKYILYRTTQNKVKSAFKEHSQNHEDLHFDEYFFNKDKYTDLHGVPEEIATKLDRLDTLEIVTIWKSICRTMSKYQLKPGDHIEEILKSCEQAIAAYYYYKNKSYRAKKQPRFNFAGCICGKLKKILLDQLTKKVKDINKIMNLNVRNTAKIMLNLSDNHERAAFSLYQEYNPNKTELDEIGVY
ncbi:hypothetical protein [Priestia flexa]|uniref:hypothetical protein n=1 Tax=Priestia flexa TaxID=86664 RepID=UPI00077CB36D|nr:hypothetical protein [Priestia flexa]MED4587866.1 hypothetical protein [Priestia flexa]